MALLEQEPNSSLSSLSLRAPRPPNTPSLLSTSGASSPCLRREQTHLAMSARCGLHVGRCSTCSTSSQHSTAPFPFKLSTKTRLVACMRTRAPLAAARARKHKKLDRFVCDPLILYILALRCPTICLVMLRHVFADTRYLTVDASCDNLVPHLTLELELS